jgi:hypothetical protein
MYIYIQCPKKPYSWMSVNGWLNVLQMASSGLAAFKSILEDLERNELLFAPWYVYMYIFYIYEDINMNILYMYI